MPIARPAAEIEPWREISSRSRVLPGPIEPQPLNSTRSESRATLFRGRALAAAFADLGEDLGGRRRLLEFVAGERLHAPLDAVGGRLGHQRLVAHVAQGARDLAHLRD